MLDVEWWKQHRESAPITELGVAVILGQDIIKFCDDPEASLKDLFREMNAAHARVLENTLMLNRGDWVQDMAQENFLFDTTGFVSTETAKMMMHVYSARSCGSKMELLMSEDRSSL